MSPEHQREFNRIVAETFALIARARHLIEDGFTPDEAVQVACQEDDRQRKQQRD